MDPGLSASFRECRRLARRQGKNFYFSFLTLPRHLQRDMCALYAFMRITDDLGDDPGRSTAQRQAALASWRRALEDALAGQAISHRILPAVADIVRRHQIPVEYLQAVIDGVEMDLQPTGFETFDDLSRYCYHVAGAVGLCCIHIWGFDDPRARDLAVDCGLAFQLTNILRDLAEDVDAGRVYLPRDELEQFDYMADDIRQRVMDERFERLMTFQVDRARSLYVRAAPLRDLVHPQGQPILTAMLRIYGGLLTEIEARRYDVYSERISLSTQRKVRIALESWWRPLSTQCIP